MSVATITVEGGIGVLTIDAPPVNALGIDVRRGLRDGFAALADDEAVEAIVLICGGRTFFAGADIGEFGKPPREPRLTEVFDLIENGAKPVVAAIHGTALGGGFEVALVCHHRIAVPSARVGLPEVSLGLLPGLGGTQRVPRIVGAEVALDLITSGRQVKADEALAFGLIDALAEEGRLREDAIAFARAIVAGGEPLTRISDRADKIAAARGDPAIFEAFRRKNARRFRKLKAPYAIVEAIEAAVTLPFDEGIAREHALFRDLESSVQSRALRHAFFAERATAKVPDVPASTATRPVERVGVIGAGTMGGGIAMSFANAGIPVTLVETSQAALDRGLGVIRRNYDTTASKGRLTTAEVERRMALITPAIGLDALADADLVVEAVFEEMAVKKDIFAALDRIARPGAILASNTSFLDLDAIAAVTTRPGSVVGLHFFSPANVMRLLEVVRGAATGADVVATAMGLARTIGKVPVLSRVCHGFIANRIMSRRGRQADTLILEGTPPAAIDRVLYDYGFAMGHFRMIDLVGLDVIGRGETDRSVRGDLVGLGRLGQKRNGGYYDYDERRDATPSLVAAGVIADVARHRGIADRGPQGDDEIIGRLLFPVVNEGARLLEEGMCLRASDIDVAAILGYGWPAHTGGPMFWADTIGLAAIVTRLKDYQDRYGDEFKPAALIERLAATGGTFTRN